VTFSLTAILAIFTEFIEAYYGVSTLLQFHVSKLYCGESIFVSSKVLYLSFQIELHLTCYIKWLRSSLETKKGHHFVITFVLLATEHTIGYACVYFLNNLSNIHIHNIYMYIESPLLQLLQVSR